ncbi:MAG TPA: DinB family protein [Ohtaekwangia sp.]
MKTETLADNKLIVSMLLKSWTVHISKVNELLDILPDEKLKEPVAPGRNTGIYLLGHLAAVHDALFPLLNFGNRLYPQLEIPFVKSPDNSGHEFPSVADLKLYWNVVNNTLLEKFNQLEPEEWLSRHTAVSEADFAKEPHRNKLNVLISRTNHLAYHWGQLVLLKGKGD